MHDGVVVRPLHTLMFSLKWHLFIQCT